MADNYNVTITLQGQNKTGPVVSQVQRDLGNLKETAEDAGGLFSNLQGVVAGALTGVAVAGIVNFGTEIYNAGRKAQLVEGTFGALTGEIGGLDSVLGTLRESTDFGIADTALEQIGSKALLTGVAGTKEELGKLVEVGSKLGRAMGMDAAEGVDNLNAAILNMSFVRLDQMGLSAAAVRTEMKELLETGRAISEEDAFKMAVLDQGQQAVERLGSSTDNATGAVERLETRWQNFVTGVGKTVATGVEGIAEGVDNAVKDIDDQLNGRIPEWKAAAIGRGTVIAQGLDQGFKDTLGEDFTAKYIEQALEYINKDPKIAAQAQLTSEQIIGLVQQGMAQLPNNQVYQIEDALGLSEAQARATAQQYIYTLTNEIFSGNQDLIATAAAATAQRAREAVQAAATAATYGRSFDDSGLYRQQMAEQMYSPAVNGLTEAGQQLAGLLGDASRRPGLHLLDPAEYQQAQQYIDRFDYFYERAQSLHDQKILTDEQFAPLKAANDDLKGLVKQADDFKKTFDDLQNMSLSGLLGQGIQTGEQANSDLGSQVMNAARAAGVSDADMQGWQDAIDKQTGAQNDASLTMRDQLIPSLVEVGQKFGAAAMVDAMDALTQELRNAKLEGRNPNLSLANLGYTQAGGSGMGYTVQKGDTPFSIAQRRGISVEDVMRMAGITDPTRLQIGTQIGGAGGVGDIQRIQMPDWLSQQRSGMSGGSTAAGAGAAGMPDFGQMATDQERMATASQRMAGDWTTINQQAAPASTSVGTMAQVAPDLTTQMQDTATAMDTTDQSGQHFSDVITALTKTKQIVNVELHVTDPSGLLTLAAGLDAKGLADIVHANGGKTPGADGRRN